jgi:hypothetical protein
MDIVNLYAKQGPGRSAFYFPGAGSSMCLTVHSTLHNRLIALYGRSWLIFFFFCALEVKYDLFYIFWHAEHESDDEKAWLAEVPKKN